MLQTPMICSLARKCPFSGWNGVQMYQPGRLQVFGHAFFTKKAQKNRENT